MKIKLNVHLPKLGVTIAISDTVSDIAIVMGIDISSLYRPLTLVRAPLQAWLNLRYIAPLSRCGAPCDHGFLMFR